MNGLQMNGLQMIVADAGLLITAIIGVLICGFGLARRKRGSGRRVAE
jgi:hypothetical protein